MGSRSEADGTFANPDTAAAAALASSLGYPYSGVCYIADTVPGTGGGFRGSGVIIGPHTVLTASHLLWDADLQQGASNVYVYPGYNPATNTSDYPPGSIGGSMVWHYYEVNDRNNQLSKQQSQYDFAVIDFAADLSSYGTFGGWQNYGGGTVHMSGYPANAGHQQTDQVGTVSLDPIYSVLDYGTVAASPGNSGGPLWINQGTAQNPLPYVTGIVSTTGYACQLTSADWQTINSWEQADSYLWASPPPAPGGLNTVLVQQPNGALDYLEFSGTNLIASDLVSPYSAWNIAGEGSFNGQNALISQDPNSGAIDLLFVQNGALKGSLLEQGSGYGKVVGAGDFDHSGRTGIATQDASGQIDLLWFTGTQLTGSLLLNGSYAPVVGATDFNGDGKTDLVTQGSSGQLDFLSFTGTNLTGSVLTPQSVWSVHDVMDLGAGHSLMTSQDAASGQLDYLSFNGANLTGSMLTTGSFANAVPGGQAAANLFHV
jgi:V8-like Glu-specific endopeptidase